MDEMIMKCRRTGKILFGRKECEQHAEETGFLDFQEVPPDSTVYVCRNTGKVCLSTNEIEVYVKRTGVEVDFEEHPLTFLKEKHLDVQKRFEGKRKFLTRVKEEMLRELQVQGYAEIPAARALYFTKSRSLTAAKKWLEEHLEDEDVNEIPEINESEEFIEARVLEVENDEENPKEVQNVNLELLNQLVEMGFPKIASEKALFLTKNWEILDDLPETADVNLSSGTLEQALEWLQEEQEKEDFLKPLREVPSRIRKKRTLTPEEAEAKAIELSKKLRIKKQEEEKLEALAKERERIESGKKMRDTQETLGEEQRKRDLGQISREKEEERRHREELKLKLRQDYIERFGVEPPDEEGVRTLSKKDQILKALNSLKRISRENPEIAKCLQTLKVYISNLVKEPQNTKFHRIKSDNRAFQDRVRPFSDAVRLLEILGFKEEDGFFVLDQALPDGFSCSICLKYLDIVLGQL